MIKNKNLVLNSKFLGSGHVKDWKIFSPFPILMPDYEWKKGKDEKAALMLKSNGDNRIFCGWRGKVEMQSGKWYKASERVVLDNVANPDLSVLAMVGRHMLLPRVKWAKETVLEREFMKGSSPFETNDFDLFIRSTINGKIEYSSPFVAEIEQPLQRMVRIATVRFGKTRQRITTQYQQKRIFQKLEEAGDIRPDVVVLTEFSNAAGIAYENIKSYTDYAEKVPMGPTCKLFAAAAKKYKMYVIGGVIEKRGRYFYNTAVIFDRNGKFVGQYDKTHLTMVELLQGFSCGQGYPVFDLDFGRITEQQVC